MKHFNFLILVFLVVSLYSGLSEAQWGGPKEGERKPCRDYRDCHIRDVCWYDHVCWTLSDVWEGRVPPHPDW
ncbi:unnamed protein product [Caenorhabditis nigoni]|uniref:Uncharacterized protein n=1 Tax=Caenorhabditis nigoni TaxID=1611254 RepID=A0A2G5T0N3_9PELO|nr:hypothetical protein B9Z55_025795 [Caenorhabditis nigoni]